MDKVIDSKSCNIFGKKINICLPRGVKNELYFQSFSIEETYDLFMSENLPKKVLIDTANGNMSKLINLSKKIKDKYADRIELMVGNIANPETFKEYCNIGVDYVRCGIGGGSVCLTAQNVGVFYPMASLISECSEISDIYKRKTKIIADGGFGEYSEIIKALALGADYVMIGGILSKCLESCSDNFIKRDNQFIKISDKDAKSYFKEKGEIYKEYRGMSTKEVQKVWERKELKAGEGISKYNKVEYTLSGWRENFTDYLRSAMSYSNSRSLEEFIGEAQWVKISQNAFNRFNK